MRVVELLPDCLPAAVLAVRPCIKSALIFPQSLGKRLSFSA